MPRLCVQCDRFSFMAQLLRTKQEKRAGCRLHSVGPYVLKVMNCGAFSTSALVTCDRHLDMDAWLIPIVSPMDVWKEPEVQKPSAANTWTSGLMALDRWVRLWRALTHNMQLVSPNGFAMSAPRGGRSDCTYLTENLHQVEYKLPGESKMCHQEFIGDGFQIKAVQCLMASTVQEQITVQDGDGDCHAGGKALCCML